MDDNKQLIHYLNAIFICWNSIKEIEMTYMPVITIRKFQKSKKKLKNLKKRLANKFVSCIIVVGGSYEQSIRLSLGNVRNGRMYGLVPFSR